MSKYLITIPTVKAKVVSQMLDLTKPKTIAMALPKIGRKAKNPIQTPYLLINFCAFSSFSGFTCRYFSIQSKRPNVPM